MIVTPRMLLTKEGSAPCFPGGSVIRRNEDAGAAGHYDQCPSLLSTERKSLFPITGPPLQLLPSLVLVNNPELVAANHASA